MDDQTSGLILRTHLLTETSLIVHWLTPDLGRIATVAKGARRPRSPFRGKLDLFHLADLSIRRSRRSELHLLREVALRDTHRALREDLRLLRQASYCARLIEQATETETPLPGIFHLMLGLVGFLPKQRGSAAVLAFELKLLSEIGLAPDPGRTSLSAAAKTSLRQLAEGDWASLATLDLAPQPRAELRQFLHGFLIYHLGRLPEGRAAAVG